MFSFLKIMENIKVLLEKELSSINLQIKYLQNQITSFCSLPELQQFDWESYNSDNFYNHSKIVLFRENYNTEPIQLNRFVNIFNKDSKCKPFLNCFYYPQLCCHFECAYNTLQLLRVNLKRTQKVKKIILKKIKEVNFYILENNNNILKNNFEENADEEQELFELEF